MKTYLPTQPTVSRDRPERNDCTVRAYADATGVPYHEAHKVLSTIRRPKHGPSGKQLIDLLSQYGFSFASPIHGTISLGQFVKTYPKGTYYCIKRGHAFTIKDGVVYDIRAMGPRHIIIIFAEYKKPIEQGVGQ